MEDSLDKDEWHPPDPPLTMQDIQKGVYSPFKVKNERATKPFMGELEHWSALPALSYFALNAVAMRESMRRIQFANKFHPPPRLTLSDKKKDAWFNDLRNKNIPLKTLSKAIPHCYTSKMLLDVVLELEIPTSRAVWFIKCVGANQVRAIKRKALSQQPFSQQLVKGIEIEWLKEWTYDVILFVNKVIDSYDENGDWKLKMRRASQLIMQLYDSKLLCQVQFLNFLLNELREGELNRLPCIVHFIQLLWKPLTSQLYSHKLFKSLAFRYNLAKKDLQFEPTNMIIEPILLKLATTNEDAFVAPRTWQIIEPLIRNHPAYLRLAERNQSFMEVNLQGPSGWQLHLEAGGIMDSFVRPYRVEELMNALLSLGLQTRVLVKVVLCWTVRQSTNASIQLCCALLKQISSKDPSVSMPLCCIDFLFDHHLIHGSECLGSLVSELLSARLCHLGLYLQKIISSGILYTSGPVKDLHLRIFKELPFDKLSPGTRAQVHMILQKVNINLEPANIEPFVEQAKLLFSEKQCHLDLNFLSLNDRIRLADRLVKLYETVLAQLPSNPDLNLTPTILVKFLDFVEMASCASMRPLFKVLSLTLSSELCGACLVSCVLRQVHVKLMAFVCSGLIDPFASKLIAKLQWTAYDFPGAMDLVGMGPSSDVNEMPTVPRQSSPFEPNDIFKWVAWDDISALRAVIATPVIMVELNRIVPLRQSSNALATAEWGDTPNEHDVVKQLLYRPGSPDISALLSLRGEEQLVAPIVEYAQSPGADMTSLLQLVTYKAVTIEELGASHPDKFGMLRFLLLEPANELGFSLDEVETLKFIRRNYLESISIDELFTLSSSVIPMKFLSRIAHLYPDIFLNRMLPELTRSPEFSRIILTHKTEDNIEHTRNFDELLTRCTPFNLRYYQGLTVLVFHGKTTLEVVDIILKSALAQPDATSALQGLLQNLNSEIKTAIFIRSVSEFFEVGLDNKHLPLVDVYVTLVTALGGSLDLQKINWDLSQVPQFLEELVLEATEVSQKPANIGCDEQWEEVVALRKALSLVLRICVIGRVHGVALPAAALPFLEKLLNIQVFADNYRVRTFIKDSLRLLLRISTASLPSSSEPGYSEAYMATEDMFSLKDGKLSAGINPLDGIQMFSKRNNAFSPLPVWVFDLIEDASPEVNGNDSCIDLSYFEAYED